MQVDKVSDFYLIRITPEEAKWIYNEMCLKKAMGNLVGFDNSLESLGILIARAVEKERTPKIKKNQKRSDKRRNP